MTSELSILGVHGLLVTLLVALRLSASGFGLAPARRMDRLAGDGLAALVLVTPALTILGLRDLFDGTTVLAAQTFLFAQAAHLAFGALGLRALRPVTLGLSLAAVLWLYLVPILLHGGLA